MQSYVGISDYDWYCFLLGTVVDDPFIITLYFTDAIKQGEVVWLRT